MLNSKFRGAVALSVAASIWGGMFVVVKSVVNVISPVALVWLRYLVALLVLFVVALPQMLTWHWRWRDVGVMVLAGIVGNTISIVAQETGTWLSSAQLGAVVTTATPAFMVIFSWLILHERPTRGEWSALILATSGVVCVVGVHVQGAHLLVGALCLVVAALTWALMSVLLRVVGPSYPPLQVTLVSTTVAVVLLTPWVLAQPSLVPWGKVVASWQLAGGVLYLGAVSTAGAFLLWNWGVQRLRSTAAGMFFLWQPLVATILGYFLLNERIGVGLIVGAVLISAGIVCAVRFGRN